MCGGHDGDPSSQDALDGRGRRSGGPHGSWRGCARGRRGTSTTGGRGWVSTVPRTKRPLDTGSSETVAATGRLASGLMPGESHRLWPAGARPRRGYQHSLVRDRYRVPQGEAHLQERGVLLETIDALWRPRWSAPRQEKKSRVTYPASRAPTVLSPLRLLPTIRLDLVILNPSSDSFRSPRSLGVWAPTYGPRNS